MEVEYYLTDIQTARIAEIGVAQKRTIVLDEYIFDKLRQVAINANAMYMKIQDDGKLIIKGRILNINPEISMVMPEPRKFKPLRGQKRYTIKMLDTSIIYKGLQTAMLLDNEIGRQLGEKNTYHYTLTEFLTNILGDAIREDYTTFFRKVLNEEKPVQS